MTAAGGIFSGRSAAPILSDPAGPVLVRRRSFPGFGTVVAGATAAGIVALDLVIPGFEAGAPPLASGDPPGTDSASPEGVSSDAPLRHLGRALAEVGEYLAGARTSFTVPVGLPGLPPFVRRVLDETARIPWGSATTYGGLARAIGCPGGARAVGQALGRNPVPLLVPCHRVLAGGALLGGFSGGLDWKRRLLRIEGIAWTEPRAS